MVAGTARTTKIPPNRKNRKNLENWENWKNRGNSADRRKGARTSASARAAVRTGTAFATKRAVSAGSSAIAPIATTSTLLRYK